MTQRPPANLKLASKIQNDASWTDDERKFLMDYLRKPTGSVVADNEANKENIPNYNPQPVLRPLSKQVRTYEKPHPAPKKQKTTHPQPAPLQTKLVQPPSKPPQPPPAKPPQGQLKDPDPVQTSAGTKPPSVLPASTIQRSSATIPVTITSVTTPVAGTAELPKLDAAKSGVDRKREEAVRQRIREIKERVKHLEEQREESLDEQWKLFLEAEALQQHKFELRAESHRIYSEVEREIFTLRKEYAELMCVDRKLLEERE